MFVRISDGTFISVERIDYIKAESFDGNGQVAFARVYVGGGSPGLLVSSEELGQILEAIEKGPGLM